MQLRLRHKLIAAAGLLACALPAMAQSPLPLTIPGDADRGAPLAYTCTGCHGIDGAVNAYPTYHVPKLGGQNADYIEIALQGYRAGQRQHPTMVAQGSQLSDQDIADIAAYFARFDSAPTTGVSAANASVILAGEEKSTTCQACHGADGQAPSPQWPNLAGQHRSYLLESMRQYQRAERTDAVMASMVAALDDESLKQLAAYYAALPGLFQTGH